MPSGKMENVEKSGEKEKIVQVKEKLGKVIISRSEALKFLKPLGSMPSEPQTVSGHVAKIYIRSGKSQ